MALVLSCLLWCGTAAALSPEGAIRDLRHTAWGPKEGAPFTTALAQTADGYIWLGAPGGLYTFDGLRFEHVELPHDERVSSADVFSLFAPATGGLWIGFTFGGVGFLKDGRLTTYGEPDGVPPGSVKAIAQDLDGRIWVGTTSGIASLEGSRWRRYGPDSGFTDSLTEGLMVDSAGTLWAGSRNKVLLLPRGETKFREPAVPIKTLPDDNAFGAFAESPTGTVWLRTRGVLQRLGQNGQGNGRPASSYRFLLFDRDGNLWIGPGQIEGIRRTAQPGTTASPILLAEVETWDSFRESDGLTGSAGGGAVLEDREGNIWFGSARGLDRFSERNVARLPQGAKQKGGPNFTPFAAALVAGEEGRVWIGGRASDLFSVPDTAVPGAPAIDDVSCAIRAANGSIWFGTPLGLWKRERGKFERLALPPATDLFEVQAMAMDGSGALWVSIVRKGVFRLADGVWTAYGANPGLPRLTAVTLADDDKGRIWFGFTDGRLALLDGESVTAFVDQARSNVGNVTAIYARRGNVWVGGEFGLARFDGSRFVPLLPASESVFNNVTGIVETADGDLWVNGAAGFVHVTAAELGRAADDPRHRLRGEIFGLLDGVEGSAARLRPLPTAIEGTDGRLWFATNAGIYWLQPARLHRNAVPPPVLIRSVTVDGKVLAPVEGLRLPRNSSAIRIDYVGLSLTKAEKVRYRYKLDGVDRHWQDAQGRREAFYTNLGPGPHRFHVVAANNDGVWNETGATLGFVIEPTFMQSRWFIALCLIGAGALAWTLLRIRDRQVALRLRGRLEERLAERERIARELHDTLLQSTQGLILRFQAVANRIAPADPVRQLLDETLDRADEVMAEGRDRVLDLRVPIDTMSDLPKAFAAAGSDLAQGRPTAFRLEVEGEPRSLVGTVREEVYRIGRESLLNAFQHAEAAAIEVQIIYGDDEFRLRVRDDGRGMEDGAVAGRARPGHWGMQGMGERAESIGAKFHVWSRQGVGTEIELRVPASVAYRNADPASRRWRWLRALQGGKR